MINWLNALTDKDWGWWPFLSLRPKQTELMTTGRVALISVAFGGFYGPLLAAVFSFGRGASLGSFLEMLLRVVVLAPPVFFLTYRLSFAVAWNIRAKKLVGAK